MHHPVPARPLLRLLLLACLAAAGRAAGPAELPVRDMLVYRDGDRVQGRLLEEKDGVLVFRSDRFGLQRVPADVAVVIRAEQTAVAPEVPAPAGPANTANAGARREAERLSVWEHFSPALLTARLHEFFGPWHGRLAFSTEVVTDTANRSNLSLEGKLTRKWAVNEVQLNGRYDFSRTNEVTTTDLIKADGLWRHDFSGGGFTQYRPTFEWNRANFSKTSLPITDYILMQQEIGAGLTLVAKPAHQLRAGVSENLFDVWNTSPPASHTSRTSESAFVETELKLPWRMSLTDRGVYYYSFSSRDNGWENRFELAKKFTESLSTAIRHEVRQGSPDGTAQDYTRLKLLFGLDF